MTDVQETVVEYDEHKVARAQARTDRINTVNREWRALQEWKRNGKVGERPATPNFDQVQGEAFKPIRLSTDTFAVSSNGHGPRSKATEPLVYTIDGEPVRPKVNTFGELSWSGTKNLVDGKTRIKPAELAAILETQFGISNPRFTAWGPITLANGVALQVCSVDADGNPVGLASIDSARILAKHAKNEAMAQKSTTAVEKPPSLSVEIAVVTPAVENGRKPRPSRSKAAVAERAAAKATPKMTSLESLLPKVGKAKPVRQPRKGNKPVAGIKPPARRKAN